MGWRRKCQNYRKEMLLQNPHTRYCSDCAARRQAEANRRAQQWRRYWEKQRRHEAAGLVQGALACAHCGKEFHPRRSSGRYCGVRCRVAAHRARKQQ
jgi:hypothetical protein